MLSVITLKNTIVKVSSIIYIYIIVRVQDNPLLGKVTSVDADAFG